MSVYLNSFESLGSKGFRDKIDQNEALAIKIIYDVFKSINERQIKGFNKKMTDSDDIEEQWIYAFQNSFKFFEPLSDTVYFEDVLIGYKYKKFPKSYVDSKNDLPIYLEVMNYFYRDLALSFDAINNTEKVKNKIFGRKKDNNHAMSSGFNWSNSSVLKDWYKTRSKLKYSEIKNMLIDTKKKIDQCR